VAVGDVNNDGLADLAVTEYKGLRLFLNRGGGKFLDISSQAGISNPFWGVSVAFADFDRDGWLDLVVANYVLYDEQKTCSNEAGQQNFCGPAGFPGSPAKLYRNRGIPAGSGSIPRFQDVSSSSGIGAISGPGLGVVCADFDGDRWPDILLANDGQPNHLWINQRDGTFREEALHRGVAMNAMGRAEANMGIALGDADGDGLFDLFVTHLTEEYHRLWRQITRGQFEDWTAEAGFAVAAARSTGFGTVFTDFDHDGWLDLTLVNGRVKRRDAVASAASAQFWSHYREKNQLYQNLGRGKFHDVSTGSPDFARLGVFRGLASGDFDNDGAVDLLVSELGGALRLYRNIAPKKGHWLSVRAFDPRLRRDAYGAVVTVKANNSSRAGWLNPALSYAASSDPRLHFGLGQASRADEIRVLWPDGIEESFSARPANQFLLLEKGQGERVGR